MAVTILLQFLGSDNKYVDSLPYSYEIHVDLLDEMPPGKITIFLHHQQIEVAVRPHVAPRGGPEQENALRLGHLDDALNDGIENGILHKTIYLCDGPGNGSYVQGHKRCSAETRMASTVFTGQYLTPLLADHFV